MDMGLLADGFLALLLVVTIGYAVVLNRKLAALRETKDDMARMLAEFVQTTAQAEAGVRELRERASASGEDLSSIVAEASAKLEQATGLKEDLGFLIEKGDSLADRLERGIEGARASHVRPAAARPATAKAAEGGKPGKTGKAAPAQDDSLMRSLAGVR